MRPFLAMSALVLLAATSTTGAAAAGRALGDLGEVGQAHLPLTCDPAVQPDFDRALALLHSFFYGEARKEFAAVASRDPECAMAHWGVAMTYYHPLWTAPDAEELKAGQAAVDKALAAKKQDARERAYVQAIAAYYRGLDEPAPAAADAGAAPAKPVGGSCHAPAIADPRGRAGCFRREMAKVAAAFPDDVEASAFHALSLLGSAPVGDPDLVQQKQAAAILEKWYASRKDHPGLAHYLIHSYDYPPLARQGLPAAEAYAAIAPWVPHALHMPSHIFTRLGMWPENIESNSASAEAARRYAAQHHPDAASFEELHALDYLIYGYLQTTQDRKAKEVLDRLNAIEKTHPENDFVVAYAFGAIPARYALERRQWREAAKLEPRPMPFWSKMPFAGGHIAYARAVGAARSGDVVAATAAAERLRELAAAASDPRFAYFADQMQIQKDAATGLIALARGEKDEAVKLLNAAALRDDVLGKHPVSPGALLPVRELLGETLLEIGRPAEALAAFRASLAINPGRFNGTVGAARAAMAAGDAEAARRYREELAALTARGDGERAELAAIRAAAGTR